MTTTSPLRAPGGLRRRARACGAWLTLAALSALLVFASAACGDPQVPPPISLDGPTQITSVRVCLVGDPEAGPREYVDPLRCEALEFGDTPTQLRDYAYVSNQFGDSLALIDLNGSLPELVDISKGIPGVTHTPVGDGPTEVASSRDGRFVFTFNSIDQTISIVPTLGDEALRVPVGQPVLAMAALPDRDAILLLLARDRALVELTWASSCDGTPAYIEGCQPRVEAALTPLYTFPPNTQPAAFTLNPVNGRALVRFVGERSLAELLLRTPGDAPDAPTCIEPGRSAPCVVRRLGLTYGCLDGIDNDGDGLIDAQDPQCLSPDASESPGGAGRYRTSACTDGRDNDGDGLTDAQDPGCTHNPDDSETDALLPIPCSDGIDNDDDGLIDIEDPDCTDPISGLYQPFRTSEAQRPACSDGIDNDGDGQIDLDDSACADPLQDDEASTPACANGLDDDGDGLIDLDDPDCTSNLLGGEALLVNACSDGIDNDNDGAIDLDDPACANPLNTTELQGVTECSNGEDDDGDGLTDIDDPDCYGPRGRSEQPRPVHAYGPMAIDPDGRFAYVVDRTESQILILNLETGALEPANTDRPDIDALGIVVGRLPTALIARSDTITAATSEDESVRIERTLTSVNVATSRGTAYTLDIAETYRALDVDDNVLETTEVRTNQWLDLSTSSSATSTLRCTLDSATVARIRAVRGGPASGDITCEAPELPRPQALPDAPEEVSTDLVTFASRAYDTLELDDTGAVTTVPVVETNDFRIPEDSWSIVYEGVLTQRTDLIIDANAPGLLRSQGANFCGDGVVEGDLVTFIGPPTPLTEGGQTPDCTAYQNRDLTWRITEVQGGQLILAVLTPEEVATLNREEGAAAIVETLPVRECFGAGIRADIRPDGAWVVRGDRTGQLSPRTSTSGVCTERFDTLPYNNRVPSGGVFSNPYFSFQLTPGDVVPPRDFAYQFSTRTAFRPLFFDVGPTSVDMKRIDNTRGESFVFVLDSSTNLIRVLGANTYQTLSILF